MNDRAAYYVWLMERNIEASKAKFVKEVLKLRDGNVPFDQLLLYKETRRLQDYAVLPPHAFV